MSFDLHIHSSYSDGCAGIESIVRRAKEKGLKIIAIADHSIEHRFGMTESKARKRQEEIERFSSRYDIEVLSAVECGILADGEITLPDFRFDMILASIHDQLPAEEYYRRIKLCLRKNSIDVLAHIHSTLFGSINGSMIEEDEEIIDLLQEADVALEINTTHSAPPDNFLTLCSNRRIKYSVGSDTHILGRIGDVEEAFKRARKFLPRGRFILDER
jgi:putative hydrolase